jgi:hypothetical protein
VIVGYEAPLRFPCDEIWNGGSFLIRFVRLIQRSKLKRRVGSCLEVIVWGFTYKYEKWETLEKFIHLLPIRLFLLFFP